MVKLHGISSPLQDVSYVSGILSHEDIAEGSDAVFVRFDAIIIFVTLDWSYSFWSQLSQELTSIVLVIFCEKRQHSEFCWVFCIAISLY